MGRRERIRERIKIELNEQKEIIKDVFRVKEIQGALLALPVVLAVSAIGLCLDQCSIKDKLFPPTDTIGHTDVVLTPNEQIGGRHLV